MLIFDDEESQEIREAILKIVGTLGNDETMVGLPGDQMKLREVRDSLSDPEDGEENLKELVVVSLKEFAELLRENQEEDEKPKK